MLFSYAWLFIFETTSKLLLNLIQTLFLYKKIFSKIKKFVSSLRQARVIRLIIENMWATFQVCACSSMMFATLKIIL